jgi:hydroxypyruvate reductase
VEADLKTGVLETPKPSSTWSNNSVQLIATPLQSLEAAAQVARDAGLNAYVLSDELEGESREVGKVHAALARAAARGIGPFQKPCVILSGGETTVTVRQQVTATAKGRGGRAGEFCLGLAIALQGHDGIDGVENNAGALVTPQTLQRASEKGMQATIYLDRNDAYSFFDGLQELVVTGPTHTNVNDFRAILVL